MGDTSFELQNLRKTGAHLRPQTLASTFVALSARIGSSLDHEIAGVTKESRDPKVDSLFCKTSIDAQATTQHGLARPLPATQVADVNAESDVPHDLFRLAFEFSGCRRQSAGT